MFRRQYSHAHRPPDLTGLLLRVERRSGLLLGKFQPCLVSNQAASRGGCDLIRSQSGAVGLLKVLGSILREFRGRCALLRATLGNEVIDSGLRTQLKQDTIAVIRVECVVPVRHTATALAARLLETDSTG